MRRLGEAWRRHQVLLRWAATVALAVYAVTISQTANEGAATAKDAARDAKAAVAGVQDARAESIRISCAEQNERHDRTIRRLDRILNKAVAADPSTDPKEIAQARASTVFLIDALAPKRDCEARVRKLLNP